LNFNYLGPLITWVDGSSNVETLSSLELRGEREQLLVLGMQLSVGLAEDEHLGPPVLGVRRSLFQAQQTEAGGGQSQTSDSISPLFLSTANTHCHNQNLVSNGFYKKYLRDIFKAE
jgi:hypothetical protein